jgi:pilus assembly protein CpaE
MKAYIVGSADRQVEELLHAVGVRTAHGSEDDLAVLAGATAAQPEVVIVDLRGHATVPRAVGALKRQHPSTGVVIVASRLDPALMLEAMRAGVNEFVTQPLSPQDLKAALDRVVTKQPLPEPGQVFAFVGGKGGIGTTTLAVNVATVLAAAAPSSALLLDLHVSYGDAAVFLGVEPRFSIADAFENIERMDEAFLRGVVAHTKIGLDVLTSSDRAMLGHVDVRAVRTLIDCAARHYRHVVLDVPRSATTMLDGLDLSNPIVVVANQELATVRSASRMAAALRQRYGKDRVRVVVTRYDQMAEIGRKDIERVMAGPIADVFPSNYRLAVDALNRGRPLVLDNHNKLSAAYARFANSLIGKSADEPSASGRSSLRGLLSLRS